MKRINRSVCLMFLCSIVATNTFCQSLVRLYKGDQVPMESIYFNNMKNYPGGNTRLSDFKGKFIILDFWTNGCSVCIEGFPKMEALQNEFKNDLQILLVTKNNEKQLAQVFKRSPNVKNTKLPMVIGDSILSKVLFPHGAVPHHVWLDREGKVVSTPMYTETNAQNIRDMISGKTVDVMERTEIFDQEIVDKIKNNTTSLLDIAYPVVGGDLIYFSNIAAPGSSYKILTYKNNPFDLKKSSYYGLFRKTLKGEFRQSSLLENSLLLNTKGETIGLKIINMPLLHLYKHAYDLLSRTEKTIVETTGRQGVVLDIMDSADLFRFEYNSTFSYESVIPGFNLEKAKSFLRKDLEAAFGMTACIENRPVRCLIIKRTNQTSEKLWVKDQKVDENSSPEKYNYQVKYGKDGVVTYKSIAFGRILTDLMLKNKSMNDPAIVDETGFTFVEKDLKKIKDGPIKINMRITDETFPMIRNELNIYGLEVYMDTRVMPVLVLKDVYNR